MGFGWIVLAWGIVCSVQLWACEKPLTQTTLDHYNLRAKEYLERHDRVTPTIEKLRASFIALTAGDRPHEDVTIVDLGAGHGREVLHFRREDLNVLPVEPATELARLTQERSGVPVFRQTAQNLDLGQMVDGVWAMASLIHVPEKDIPQVLERVKRHLRVGGVFFISICTGVGTPNVGEVEPKGRYFNRMTPDRWREHLGRSGGFEILENLTGPQVDDFHGKDKPTDGFHFYNFFLRRVAEPGKPTVVSTSEGIEAAFGALHLSVDRRVQDGQVFMREAFVDHSQDGRKEVSWEYRLIRTERDGDLGKPTAIVSARETGIFESPSGVPAVRVREATWTAGFPQQLGPTSAMEPSGEMAALRERVFRRVAESEGRAALP